MWYRFFICKQRINQDSPSVISIVFPVTRHVLNRRLKGLNTCSKLCHCLTGTMYKMLCLLWSLYYITRVRVTRSSHLAVLINISMLKEGSYLHIAFTQETLNISGEVKVQQEQFIDFGIEFIGVNCNPYQLEMQNVLQTSAFACFLYFKFIYEANICCATPVCQALC